MVLLCFRMVFFCLVFVCFVVFLLAASVVIVHYKITPLMWKLSKISAILLKNMLVALERIIHVTFRAF